MNVRLPIAQLPDGFVQALQVAFPGGGKDLEGECRGFSDEQVSYLHLRRLTKVMAIHVI